MFSMVVIKNYLKVGTKTCQTSNSTQNYCQNIKLYQIQNNNSLLSSAK